MKSKIIVGRGTSVLEIELGSPNWVGKPFREYQEKRMGSLGSETKISIRKGTGSLAASTYPKSKLGLPTEGRIISTSRGTSTRHL